MLIAVLGSILFVSGEAAANGDDMHHDWWDHMDWDWWGIPYMGLMMILVWILFIVIAVLVYKDAERRGMNGLLWFVLVILPWVGIIFLIIYLIIREDLKYGKGPG